MRMRRSAYDWFVDNHNARTPAEIEMVVRREGIRVQTIPWKKKPLVMEHKMLIINMLFQFEMIENDMDFNTFRQLSAGGDDERDPYMIVW